MNEKMLEIAKQSGLKKEHGSDREYIGDFDWREFGKFVMEECIKAVENTDRRHCYTSYDTSLVDATISRSVQSIRQHFNPERTEK